MTGRAAALRAARISCLLLLTVAALGWSRADTRPDGAITGLSHPAALADAYDAVLDADFAAVPMRLAPACEDVPAFCTVMEAVSVWWQIALDPQDRRHDPLFTRHVERAIAATEAWTARDPRRAEAWLARGAAYGARAQWRVLRNDRLAAARDGKRIKEALETALELDPDLHDAKFGVGLYRYYAAVGPAALRFLRWMLLLPGGDREGGLQQMLAAMAHGQILRGETGYQLHLIYLWYEDRPREALTLIQQLQRRYPHNPLFALIEAEIHDVYFHDTAASERVLRALVARAANARVNASGVALRRAQHALDALTRRTSR